MRSAELTGAGESVKVRQEGKVNHYFHREPCGRTREGAFEASAAARALTGLRGSVRGTLGNQRSYRDNSHCLT